jgi:hypothetical protein
MKPMRSTEMDDVTTIEIRNPSFARIPGEEAVQSVAFPAFAKGDSIRLGLLNNLKPNTSNLIHLVTTELATHYRIETLSFEKEDGAHGAPEEFINELHAFADVVITTTCD